METETKKETAEYKDVESQIIDSPEGEFRIPEGADIDVSVSETPDKKLRITETVTVDEHEYLECEKRWVFLLLMMVGGFFGGFTYSVRGGVFCNAQTANIVLLGLSLGRGQFAHAAYYLLPISAYLLGSFVSEHIALPIKRLRLIRWDTLFILIEMLTVVVLALIPETAPYQISQVMINFICSMQYNTFRQAQSVPMATTFCTNHVRQVGVAISKAIRHKDKSPYVSRMLLHLGMLGMFLTGVISSVLLAGVFLGKAMFFALIPLGVIAADLLHADLTTEKNILDRKPHGH